ncbi:MAG: hypothetical protein SPF70_06330 [Lachnospiraceae bacterium]|nr:hypothetical protein [Lachnospiraceae bacterium]
MAEKIHRRNIKLLFALLLFVLFCLTPPAAYVRSIAVMSVYSASMKKESLLKEKGFSVNIPGGAGTKEADWYPFVMTFVDNEGFQTYTGNENLSLTILYNFPSFDLLHGCSRIYDRESEYYNSFYGAYLVSEKGEPYGFYSDGTINQKEILEIPKFDFYELVLEDFGLKERDFVFECDVTEEESDVPYAGLDGWSRVDADILVSGIAHNKRRGETSYLQYGKPANKVNREFETTRMKGRIYGRYFPEWDVSIFFYIIAGSENVLEQCDKEIVSESRIEK